jgi:N-acetylglucosamine kinase-like BadF-type ATPase
MALIVGVDAGGTKTTGVVADETGMVLRRARGAGANLHVHGELAVEKVLADVLEELCPDDRPEALCLGMAGVDRPGEEQVVRSLLRRLGLRANAAVVNDAIIAIAAGAPDRVGVVVIAGTGSIAYGIDGHGSTARAGGLGPRSRTRAPGAGSGTARFWPRSGPRRGEGPRRSCVRPCSRRLR